MEWNDRDVGTAWNWYRRYRYISRARTYRCCAIHPIVYTYEVTLFINIINWFSTSFFKGNFWERLEIIKVSIKVNNLAFVTEKKIKLLLILTFYYNSSFYYTVIDILCTNLYSSRFIFRRPLLSTVSNIFTLPFQRNVWIAIAVFFVLIFCLLYLSIKWEYNRDRMLKSTAYWNMNPSKPTVSDNLLILLGAFSQQGKETVFGNNRRLGILLTWFSNIIQKSLRY